MYTITLNDGTKIEGLTFEKNIFWSNSPITAKSLHGKLNPVTITSTEPDYTGITGTHAHMDVCYVKVIDGRNALALADIPDDRWEFEKLRADVDFAIMLGGSSF